MILCVSLTITRQMYNFIEGLPVNWLLTESLIILSDLISNFHSNQEALTTPCANDQIGAFYIYQHGRRYW